MKLSVIIPVYNEERTIEKLIEKVRSIQLPGIDKELIIVDDNSIDQTKNILERMSDPSVMRFCNEYNKGKGGAIRTGMRYSSGDIILIQDGDLEYEPNDYAVLLAPIINNGVDVVYGSRFLNKNNTFILRYFIANKFLVWLTNILYGSSLTDMETCYKVFKSDILRSFNLEASGFELEPEVTAKTLMSGYDIYEVPIAYKSRDRSSGKKIGFFDGLISIYTLIKYRIKGRCLLKRSSFAKNQKGFAEPDIIFSMQR